MSESKNELETLLEQAATEAAYRPAFFRVLMESTVWVPGKAAEGQALPKGDVLEEDLFVELQHWQKDDHTSVIPFFSSPEALQRAVAPHEQSFVAMPVRTLFEMTLGSNLFLNAKLPTGKEFTPSEITHLLSAEGDALTQQRVVEGGTSLLLSEVFDPPAQMIDSLTTLFKKHKNVKRAFLCSMKEHAGAKPNMLIGIEADNDLEEIIRQTGIVATDTLVGDEPIDICQVVEGGKGMSHFMIAHIIPFYERRWGSFLRDFKARRII